MRGWFSLKNGTIMELYFNKSSSLNIAAWHIWNIYPPADNRPGSFKPGPKPLSSQMTCETLRTNWENSHGNHNWLVVSTSLKNDGVPSVGIFWNSQYDGKFIRFHGSSHHQSAQCFSPDGHIRIFRLSSSEKCSFARNFRLVGKPSSPKV